MAGDCLTCGLKKFIMVTIRRRESKTRRAGLEIVNIMKDYRAQLIGGARPAP